MACLPGGFRCLHRCRVSTTQIQEWPMSPVCLIILVNVDSDPLIAVLFNWIFYPLEVVDRVTSSG